MFTSLQTSVLYGILIMLTGIKRSFIKSCRITQELMGKLMTMLTLCCVLFSQLSQAAILSSANSSHSQAQDKISKTKQLLGSTHFGWLNLIQEKPDFIEDWETLDEQSAYGHLMDQVTVSYPNRSQPLSVQGYVFQPNNHVLSLKDRTVFEFPHGATYVGVHYLREIAHREPLTFLITNSEGEQQQFKSCTKSDELEKFSGFLGGDKAITRLEIRKPLHTSYVLGDVFWGRKDDLQQAQHCGSNLAPVVTSVECTKQGWLFDVEVGAMQSNDDSWWCVNDDEKKCGTYGEIVSFGYYSKAEQPQVELIFADQKKQNCQRPLIVDAPENCSENCNYILRGKQMVEICPDRKSTVLLNH